MNDKKFTKMATIAKTYERCEAEGIGISKNLIRQLVLTRTIPTVRVGKNTHLINYDQLMQFLENGTPQQRNASDGSIRRIEAI